MSTRLRRPPLKTSGSDRSPSQPRPTTFWGMPYRPKTCCDPTVQANCDRRLIESVKTLK